MDFCLHTYSAALQDILQSTKILPFKNSHKVISDLLKGGAYRLLESLSRLKKLAVPVFHPKQ